MLGCYQELRDIIRFTLMLLTVGVTIGCMVSWRVIFAILATVYVGAAIRAGEE